jgi:hypothetical protein
VNRTVLPPLSTLIRQRYTPLFIRPARESVPSHRTRSKPAVSSRTVRSRTHWPARSKMLAGPCRMPEGRRESPLPDLRDWDNSAAGHGFAGGCRDRTRPNRLSTESILRRCRIPWTADCPIRRTGSDPQRMRPRETGRTIHPRSGNCLRACGHPHGSATRSEPGFRIPPFGPTRRRCTCRFHRSRPRAGTAPRSPQRRPLPDGSLAGTHAGHTAGNKCPPLHCGCPATRPRTRRTGSWPRRVRPACPRQRRSPFSPGPLDFPPRRNTRRTRPIRWARRRRCCNRRLVAATAGWCRRS